MNNLVGVFLMFQSPEFWNTIEKCEIEKEREQSIREIRNNAKDSLKKFVFLLLIGCLITFSLGQIF